MESRKRWNAKLVWEVVGDVKEDGQQETYRITEEHINVSPEVVAMKGYMLAQGQVKFVEQSSGKYLK